MIKIITTCAVQYFSKRSNQIDSRAKSGVKSHKIQAIHPKCSKQETYLTDNGKKKVSSLMEKTEVVHVHIVQNFRVFIHLRFHRQSILKLDFLFHDIPCSMFFFYHICDLNY